MRLVISALVLCALAGAQTSAPSADPAYSPLSQAYQYLQAKDYDQAVAAFEQAIAAAPTRPSIRKDLAYTLVKIGETEMARDQFGEAMRLDANDTHVALEYAFLCFETKKQAEARRIFDRIRKTGDPASRATAEQAFQNIDVPLKTGIERWKRALELSPESFSAHHELATLAEQRDELDLAAEHYLKAWRLLPGRKYVLVDLGRVWKALGRIEEANAALLAASRGGEPRAAEAARELLPQRYPYVYEFRRSLDLDTANVELRRELAYLLLRMNHKDEAEREFKIITERAPEDLLSAAQLGFLYLARNDRAAALPLLERVLKGSDAELANRVRAALQIPQVPTAQPRSANTPPEKAAVEAKVMAERSIKAGYMKDALKYLKIAHEADPLDFAVMLQLGYAYNMLHDDQEAIRWFALARQSPDSKISSDASRAFNNLRPGLAHLRTTTWLFPFYSTRWHDVFSYGQIKTEFKLGNLPFRPYLSTRFVGDTRGTTGGALPQYLSESSFILGAGVATRYWHGIMGWAEAGEAMSYLGKHPGTGAMVPDYRGGLAFARGWGHHIRSEKPGLFFETNADGVYLSRFGKDFLAYSQNRAGFTPPALTSLGSLRMQLYLNGNFTMDDKRQAWANFAEAGPGLRFRWPWMPPSLMFSVNVLRGAYTIPQYGARKPNFFDVRAGFWYAFTH
ncbi:MAG TPA: tetratricopeptide repeat protein [Bryobacteraceae bacterium]|nr:tetratricopeptide repeat protein [Bryobacteraceae bacterium]